MSHCLNMLTCTTRGSNVFSTLRVLISRLLGSQLSTVWAWLKLPLACNEVSMIENCLFLALSLESAPTKNDEKNYCLWTLLLKRFSSLKSFPGKKWLHEFSTFFRKNAEYADQKGTMDGVPISCLIKSIQMNVLSPHWRKLRSFYERRLLPEVMLTNFIKWPQPP